MEAEVVLEGTPAETLNVGNVLDTCLHIGHPAGHDVAVLGLAANANTRTAWLMAPDGVPLGRATMAITSGRMTRLRIGNIYPRGTSVVREALCDYGAWLAAELNCGEPVDDGEVAPLCASTYLEGFITNVATQGLGSSRRLTSL